MFSFAFSYNKKFFYVIKNGVVSTTNVNAEVKNKKNLLEWLNKVTVLFTLLGSFLFKYALL